MIMMEWIYSEFSGGCKCGFVHVWVSSTDSIEARCLAVSLL